MSYGQAAALQEAVFGRLSADPALAALVGTAVFDTPPSGPAPAIYLSLGPEDARRRGDADGAVVEHRIEIAVVTQQESFATAKAAAAAAEAALTGAAISLPAGRLMRLEFLRGRAQRGRRQARRRIEMTFRAVVDET